MQSRRRGAQQRAVARRQGAIDLAQAQRTMRAQQNLSVQCHCCVGCREFFDRIRIACAGVVLASDFFFAGCGPQTTDICCYRCRRCFSYNSNSFRNTLAAPWTIKRWGRQSSQEASGARGASWQRGQRCSERAPVACASTPAARAPNVAVCRAQCRPDRVVGGGGATMAEQWTGVARGIHTCS